MLLYIILIVIFCLFLTFSVWVWMEVKKFRKHAQELFMRAWKTQLFLMNIYNDCPKDVQNKIENYLNSIESL